MRPAVDGISLQPYVAAALCCGSYLQRFRESMECRAQGNKIFRRRPFCAVLSETVQRIQATAAFAEPTDRARRVEELYTQPQPVYRPAKARFGEVSLAMSCTGPAATSSRTPATGRSLITRSCQTKSAFKHAIGMTQLEIGAFKLSL